jgi:CRISPR-associated endonuclease/helicase Cas3
MTPSPAQVTLQPPTLDAWTLTSVDVDWPVACDVDPYLHGLRDDERNTEVAWRREFDDVAADDLAEENLEKIFEVYPLRPRELLKEPTANVVRFLLDLKDKRPDAWVVVAGRVLKTLVLKTLTERALEEEIVNRTVIIPAKHGGLNQSGILDTSQIGTPANDVADQLSNKPHDSADASEDRVRIVLTKTGGEWAWDSPPGGALLDPGPTEEGWRKWQRDFSGLNGNEWRLAYAIERPSHDEDDGVGGVQMFWRRASTKRAATVRLLLDDHNRDVHERAEASAAAVGLAATLFRAVSHAAAAHDLGKGRELWQKAVYNNDPALKLAKSTGRGMKWQSLDGYRHEYGSLNDLLKQEEFARLGEDAGDLALHLVAAHHGRGRPHFPKGGRDPESAGTPASELTPAAIALRFIRLQRKYGPWGLAWLESMLVCADREASQNPKRRT